MARQIALTVGPPIVLANVAGIGLAADVLETSDEDGDRIIGVNLTGAFPMTRALLPTSMRAARKTFTCEAHGRFTAPGMPPGPDSRN